MLSSAHWSSLSIGSEVEYMTPPQVGAPPCAPTTQRGVVLMLHTKASSSWTTLQLQRLEKEMPHCLPNPEFKPQMKQILQKHPAAVFASFAVIISGDPRSFAPGEFGHITIVHVGNVLRVLPTTSQGRSNSVMPREAMLEAMRSSSFQPVWTRLSKMLLAMIAATGPMLPSEFLQSLHACAQSPVNMQLLGQLRSVLCCGLPLPTRGRRHVVHAFRTAPVGAAAAQLQPFTAGRDSSMAGDTPSSSSSSSSSSSHRHSSSGFPAPSPRRNKRAAGRRDGGGVGAGTADTQLDVEMAMQGDPERISEAAKRVLHNVTREPRAAAVSANAKISGGNDSRSAAAAGDTLQTTSKPAAAATAAAASSHSGGRLAMHLGSRAAAARSEKEDSDSDSSEAEEATQQTRQSRSPSRKSVKSRRAHSGNSSKRSTSKNSSRTGNTKASAATTSDALELPAPEDLVPLLEELSDLEAPECEQPFASCFYLQLVVTYSMSETLSRAQTLKFAKDHRADVLTHMAENLIELDHALALMMSDELKRADSDAPKAAVSVVSILKSKNWRRGRSAYATIDRAQAAARHRRAEIERAAGREPVAAPVNPFVWSDGKPTSEKPLTDSVIKQVFDNRASSKAGPAPTGAAAAAAAAGKKKTGASSTPPAAVSVLPRHGTTNLASGGIATKSSITSASSSSRAASAAAPKASAAVASSATLASYSSESESVTEGAGKTRAGTNLHPLGSFPPLQPAHAAKPAAAASKSGKQKKSVTKNDAPEAENELAAGDVSNQQQTTLSQPSRDINLIMQETKLVREQQILVMEQQKLSKMRAELAANQSTTAAATVAHAASPFVPSTTPVLAGIANATPADTEHLPTQQQQQQQQQPHHHQVRHAAAAGDSRFASPYQFASAGYNYGPPDRMTPMQQVGPFGAFHQHLVPPPDAYQMAYEVAARAAAAAFSNPAGAASFLFGQPSYPIGAAHANGLRSAKAAASRGGTDQFMLLGAAAESAAAASASSRRRDPLALLPPESDSDQLSASSFPIVYSSSNWQHQQQQHQQQHAQQHAQQQRLHPQRVQLEGQETRQQLEMRMQSIQAQLSEWDGQPNKRRRTDDGPRHGGPPPY
jgi:hypothetical protein